MKNIAIIGAGQGAPQGENNYCNNGTPFVKAGNLQELIDGVDINDIQKVSEEVAEKHKLKKYSKGTILFAKSGMSCMKGYVYVLSQDAHVVSHLACITPKGDYSDYLRYYFTFHRPNQLVKDAAYPSISLSDIGDLEIDMKTDLERKNIVNQLQYIEKIISLRKQEILTLDDLIKARFVEMFGDPVINPHGWEKPELRNLADLKIGPFGSLLHKEDYIEGGHPLVNPSHIVDGRIMIDPKLTVSDEKYEELSAYHLKIGDVVIGRRGEMGRCAVIEEEGLLCGTGSLLIRPKGSVTADYIQKIISYPTFKKTIEDMAVGQTMPNLNVPIVSGFRIISPPIEVQNSYYDFVAQVDKLKLQVQKSLDETQLLFDSLMQQYFG